MGMRLAFAFVAVLSALPAAAMDFCSGSVRLSCVVDGDTVWLEGAKIRLKDIDAPEVVGGCESERLLSARAAGRLAELLGGGRIEIERHGQDRYGRTLGTLFVNGADVGATLVAEGLARTWRGKRENWCN